jgi:D-alanine-D-alanine ligase
LPKETFRELDAESVLNSVTQSIALPVVVKPARGGSAQGVSIVTKLEDLNRAMVDAYVYCDVVIIEKLVEGVELALSVIDLGAGPIALPAVEVVPRKGHFSYDERYTAGETDYFIPARLDEKTSAAARKVAVSAHEVLGLRHLSRIDMIVDANGIVWFLEANVLPGLTETSLLPMAITASGNSLGEVYYSLAEAAKRG